MRREPTANDDPIARQLRRVRRRRNAYAAQLGVYGAVGALGTAGALVVALASCARPCAFVLGAAAAALAALVAVAAVARAAARRWTSAVRAPHWIDAQAKLGGRLATLAELPGRDGALVPLLVADNLVRLDTWRPARLVRRPAPLAALAAALGGGALVLALLAAPPLVPPPPAAAGPLGVSLAADAGAGPADKSAAALAPAPTAAPGAAAARFGRDAVARSSLRDLIRRPLLGAPTAPQATATPAAPRDAPGGGEGERGPTGRAGAGAETPAEAARPGFPSPARAARASGAGDGTDPDLFAAADDDVPLAAGRFAVGLGARVRGPAGGLRPPSGEPPPADADAAPRLAPDASDAVLPERPRVAAGWEAAVRAAFRHDPEEEDR